MSYLPLHRAAARSVLATALSRNNSRLAITGATGWLGRALAEMAFRAGLTPDNGRLRIFASRSGTLSVEGSSLPLEALAQAPALEGDQWILVHLAGLGRDRTPEMSPAAFVETNDVILRSALRLADKATGLRVLYSSSGGIYGRSGLVASAQEEPYGYMKSLQEAEVAEWCLERGVPAIIPRVFNVGGPSGNKLDLYALSSLTMAALAGGEIKIAAPGPVFRSYVHIEEMMAVLIDMLTHAKAELPLPFDTAGRETVELGDLAVLICEAAQVDPSRISRRYDPTSPASWYVGQGRAYRLAVARSGLDIVPLRRIVEDTIVSLRASAA